jgi:Zn-dependent peptidase ImmA (M78 family)
MIVTLADLVGVSRQTISAYEHGELSPQPENLYRIASVLNMPVGFFSLPPRGEDDAPTFYRSLAGASKTSRLAADRRLLWVGDIVARLADYVTFPAVQFPVLVDRGRMPLSDEAIEEAASGLRAEWGLGDGPIHNTVSLIESKGGFVTRGEAESAAIDAFSKWLPGAERPCVFLGNEKGSRARSRFDAAHETGHMVMHRAVPKTQVAIPAELSVLEAEANAFASAFLLPAESFAEDLLIPTVDGMRALKPKWKVSVAAMLHRSADLKIVDENAARRQWISLARRGWRRAEPGDDMIPSEHPTALTRAFELIVDAGLQSPAQMLDRLNLNPRDVQRFASLPPEFLADDVAPVRLLDHARERSTIGESADGGDVVPFRRLS